MGARFRSWRQKIQEHPFVTMGIIVLFIVLIVLIIAVVLSNGTGFNEFTIKSTATETTLSPQTKVTTTAQSQPGKTLWDLLQLLIIPLMLAIGGFWFNQIQKSRDKRATEQRDKTEREIAADNQREIALQAYFDKMSEILLDTGTSTNRYTEHLIRARTLTTLRRLNTDRKESMFKFLHETGLLKEYVSSHLQYVDLKHVNLVTIDPSETKVDFVTIDLSKAKLSGADLSEANLYRANLSEADLEFAHLRGTILSSANLSKAILYKADLSGAILSRADLSGATLSGANLSNAFLSGANLRSIEHDGVDLSNAILRGVKGITEEELEEKAKSLKGATMLRGNIHP